MKKFIEFMFWAELAAGAFIIGAVLAILWGWKIAIIALVLAVLGVLAWYYL